MGSSGSLGELRFLLLFAIWFINAGTPAVNPVAASEPIAPSNGFAIRSLFVETYEDTFLKAGASDDLKELKTFDIVSTNPLPVMCFLFLE